MITGALERTRVGGRNAEQLAVGRDMCERRHLVGRNLGQRPHLATPVDTTDLVVLHVVRNPVHGVETDTGFAEATTRRAAEVHI
jgi:hypothetical protein